MSISNDASPSFEIYLCGLPESYETTRRMEIMANVHNEATNVYEYVSMGLLKDLPE